LLHASEIAGHDIPDTERFRREILERGRPVVIRGLVADWPVVAAARSSPRSLKGYLATFDTGARVEAYFGDPAIRGKYYYAEGLKGFNFERRMMPFLDALEAIVQAHERPDARSVYVGAVPTAECLPGFAAANPLALAASGASARIWLGSPANVSSHHDTYDNLACVIAGTRRFTLYAPELIGKLYPGPIDNTMAGATVSLAASAAESERSRFPLFEQIRDQALVAEVGAGDALYLPKLWWHQVESTAPFNGLINYWWDGCAAGPDSPYTALLLAMITIAERPSAEREAWKAFFDHFVFRPDGHPLRHLPPEQHGILGPLKPDNYSRIRARILHLLRTI
jgi:hypothetical protein